MKLFDNKQGNDLDCMCYMESNYSYLNRSARPELKKIRNLLEEWFKNYPDSVKTNLKSRFIDNNDSNHNSAFFELFLHELLIKLGCEVQIEPSVTGTQKRPDFLVNTPDGFQFFLEAVLATGESIEESANRARINQVYDTLNRMKSPDFFIVIKLNGAPSSPPPGKKLRKDLEKWLSSINPNDPVFKTNDIDLLPSFPFSHDGWDISFIPIPKKKEYGNEESIRPLAMWLPEKPHLVKTDIQIRDAVNRKARKYGKLDIPYLIAVNVLGDDAVFGHEKIDVMNALFGQEVITIQENLQTKEISHKLTRCRNGAFISGNGPINTRVSGVLVSFKLSPSSLTKTNLHLYHNPWAEKPYNLILNCLHQEVPKSEDGQTSRMVSVKGKLISQIFNLPDEWPWDNRDLPTIVFP
jgi:hypothetical protein